MDMGLDTSAAVLVTGAAGEIGSAVVESLTAAQVSVIGVGRRAPADFPGRFLECDLADEAATEQLAAGLAAEGVVGAVVHCAGIADPAPVEDVTAASLDRVLAINVRSCVQLVAALAPSLRAADNGRIVVLASRAIYGSRDRTAYSAAKSALVGCVRTWALEFAESGATANAVAPGPVDTAMFRRGHPEGSQSLRTALESIPMGYPGKPQDVAAAIEFLLSPAARYITGQVLGVDGGASLAGR